MAVQKIIIDCDPGIDDALALLFGTVTRTWSCAGSPPWPATSAWT